MNRKRVFRAYFFCLNFSDRRLAGGSLTLRIGMVVVAVSMTVDALRIYHSNEREIGGLKSYKGHTVDALAVRGDEGRRSLRKASGSGQARDEPKISEWGNPTL